MGGFTKKPARAWLALAVLGASLGATEASADCISLVKGPIAFDVSQCSAISPERSFDLSNDRYTFIKNLPANEKKKFYDSYRGLVLKGVVARSQAVRSGLSPEKGALAGDEISVFIRPGQANCATVDGQRLVGAIDEICCEGGGDAPCLLPSAYVLKDFKAYGPAKGSAAAKKQKMAKSEEYKKAEEALAKKDYKKAVAYFEKARAAKELDIKGHYQLASLFYRMDLCPKAIPVLRNVQDKYAANDFWADDEPFVRRSNFLLARCYAKENEPEFASVILNSYLSNPRKYRRELQMSLKHKDFGWIHTSKEYQKYEKDARSALGKLR